MIAPPLYNVALLLDNESIAQQFVDYAQSNFAVSADKYLLGKNALPHVTLCQFRAETEKNAKDAFDSWDTKQSLELHLDYLYIRPGSGNHIQKTWICFAIKHSEKLIELQHSCYANLQKNGLSVHTKIQGYLPHITLARLSEWPQMSLPIPSSATTFSQSIFARPALGLSSEEGVFLHTL